MTSQTNLQASPRHSPFWELQTMAAAERHYHSVIVSASVEIAAFAAALPARVDPFAHFLHFLSCNEKEKKPGISGCDLELMRSSTGSTAVKCRESFLNKT
jgi:hypothetical protein